jgi:alkylation response protein AidB-like acyl-CoA dehydrogenase
METTETDREGDLLELRATLRRLLERHAPTAPAVSAVPGGYDPQLWKLLTHQVGVAGLAVPERLGGSGGGYLECHLVLEELGRAVVASPFLASSVLATQALLLVAGDDAAAQELLSDLAAGTRTAVLVLDADTTSSSSRLTASGVDGDRVIDGQARHVLDGARAQEVLAFAQTGTGSALFLLDPAHPGLERDLLPTVDQSLHLAEVRCRAVPARRLSAVDAAGSGRPATSRLADLAAIAITAEQVGGARRCLELTVEYARHRIQFGRPIGSFQAVKHRLADLLVLVESADSASQAAARAWELEASDDGDPENVPVLASLAKSYCSEAYRAVAAETIQLHGGLGFTWEHPAHRYFKRAHSTSYLFGDPSYHRLRLADHLKLRAAVR